MPAARPEAAVRRATRGAAPRLRGGVGILKSLSEKFTVVPSTDGASHWPFPRALGGGSSACEAVSPASRAGEDTQAGKHHNASRHANFFSSAIAAEEKNAPTSQIRTSMAGARRT